MTTTRIRLYNEFTARWREAFQDVVGRVIEAEASRLGQTVRRCDDLLPHREGTERLANTGSGVMTYWRTYLAVSTSPESGVRRRLNRLVTLSVPVATITRSILALARDLPRDCEEAVAAVASRLGAAGTRFEIWEPKDVRRRVHAAFGITCPALHLFHLEQLLAALSPGNPRSPIDRLGAEADDETLGTLFISYASEDRPFVERLVKALDPFVSHVWYDRHEIIVGDSIVNRINEGLSSADFLIAVLSRASVAKPWVQSEMASAIMRQNSESTIRLLPILKEEREIPPLLMGVQYADFRVHFETGINELLQGLQGIRERRDRPTA
jgi:TIR domain